MHKLTYESSFPCLGYQTMASAKGKPATVSELQSFLRERGVTFSDYRKHELSDLVQKAFEIKLPIDPEALIEDRAEVIGLKLRDLAGPENPRRRNVQLQNPGFLSGSTNINILPEFSEFDVCTYQLSASNASIASVRDYRKSEGFQMMRDGYVVEIQACGIPSLPSEPPTDGYFAVKSKVKPRTREKDPVTGAKFYSQWIVMTSVDMDLRSCILSAFCTCKGGLDGYCRHVLATLYEVIDYRTDSKTSVTSESCRWVRRATESSNGVLLTDIQTDLVQRPADETPVLRPTEEMYQPVPGDLPSPEDFLTGVRDLLPQSCLLDAWEERTTVNPPPPPLRVKTPTDRLRVFKQTHVCIHNKCDSQCAVEFVKVMQYTREERETIDKDTEGQYKNPNWHDMRTGLLTGSNVKKVICSTDRSKTATNLLKGNVFDEDNLPAPVAFGRKCEHRAMILFKKLHRHSHKKFKARVPGLIISTADPFIAATPDGIVTCKTCGRFVVEIKCVYSKRNFHPKAAALASGICEKDANGDLYVVQSHAYYAQIQCEMAATGCQTTYLVVFTRKGVEPVRVSFNKTWWQEQMVVLRSFYLEVYFPAWSALSGTGGGDVPDAAVDSLSESDASLCDAMDVAMRDVDGVSEAAACDATASDVIDSAMEVVGDETNIPDTADFREASHDDHDVSAHGTDPFLDSIESARQHRQLIEEEMANFCLVLARQNFCLHDHTPSDGNCFFWAVCSQLHRTGAVNLDHKELRKMVCDSLSELSASEKAELGRSITNQTFDQYVAGMRRNGMCADHIVLEYTSRMLSTPITVIDPAGTVHVGSHFRLKDRHLYLGFIPGLSHYVSVVPIAD